MNWVSTGVIVVLLVALAALGYAVSAERQHRRNAEGALVAARLDLDAARERIAELQTYLADHESWSAQPRTPVPLQLADESVPDRWSAARRPPDDAATTPSLPA